jgi:hypothetical protein
VEKRDAPAPTSFLLVVENKNVDVACSDSYNTRVGETTICPELQNLNYLCEPCFFCL